MVEYVEYNEIDDKILEIDDLRKHLYLHMVWVLLCYSSATVALILGETFYFYLFSIYYFILFICTVYRFKKIMKLKNEFKIKPQREKMSDM